MKDYPTPISTSFDHSLSDSEPLSNSAADQSRKLEQLRDDEFWEYARKLAELTPVVEQPEEYLTCTLSQGQCLIPLASLHEVVRSSHRIAPLPAVPVWMPGVVAWRGETIAVVDLETYLTGSTLDISRDYMLLIAKYADFAIGLLVSAIGMAVSLSAEGGLPLNENHPAVAWCHPTRTEYIKGIQDQALVLDVDLVLRDMVQEIGSAASYG
jgi:chemotaxis signal transduction protein